MAVLVNSFSLTDGRRLPSARRYFGTKSKAVGLCRRMGSSSSGSVLCRSPVDAIKHHFGQHSHA